jgi:hypothetical protein
MFAKKTSLKFIFVISLIIFSGNLSFAKRPKNYHAIIYSVNNERYKGFLQDVTDKGVTIDFYGKSKFISADSISSIKIKRSSALKRHALTAGGIGLLAGIPVYIDGNNKGQLSSLALPVVVIASSLGGALVGTLINTVTSVQRFDKINKGNSYKSIQPVLLRYSKASPTRVPLAEK